MRYWNHHSFGIIDTQIAKTKAQIEALSSGNSTGNQNESLEDLEKKLIYWIDAQADFWKQRNRDEDLRNGDKNTSYFHNKVNFRKKRTNIDTLKNYVGD